MSHPGWFLLQGFPKFISWFVWVAIPTGPWVTIPVRSSEKNHPLQKTTEKIQNPPAWSSDLRGPFIPSTASNIQVREFPTLQNTQQLIGWSIPPFHQNNSRDWSESWKILTEELEGRWQRCSSSPGVHYSTPQDFLMKKIPMGNFGKPREILHFFLGLKLICYNRPIFVRFEKPAFFLIFSCFFWGGPK